MSSDITPRTAIVTGGSGGIGRAVAERLGADGQAVVVAYAGNARRADAARAAITQGRGAGAAFRADIADEQQVAGLFNHAEREHGGVDVVVNTAGIMLLAPLAEIAFDDFDRMMRTNVRGTF